MSHLIDTQSVSRATGVEVKQEGSNPMQHAVARMHRYAAGTPSLRGRLPGREARRSRLGAFTVIELMAL